MKLKISYSLKSGINGVVPIVATLSFGQKEMDLKTGKFIYKQIKYYIDVKVKREDWDNELKQTKNKLKLSEFLVKDQKIKDIFNSLNIRDEVSLENLKNELDEKLKGRNTTVVKRVRIVDFIIDEIMTSTSLKLHSKKAYNGLANKLIAFEKVIGKPLYSNELNEELYKQFMETEKKNLNKINSVWSVQKDFKATLHEIARKYKLNIFDPAQELSAKDRVQCVSPDNIYLKYEQIKKIIDHEPSTEKLQNTKLILLTLLFTGCRESDVYKIQPNHFYEKEEIQFHYAHYFSEKTDTEIIVPILKPLADAFEKNGGNPAYQISQQKFNEYVKDLIEECKLTEDITISFVDATGKKQFETKKLFQFVSSHIGRRSFVTNLINYIPITILTKITGHKIKDKSLIFGYNKISLLDNAILFRKQLKQAADENPDHFLFHLI